MEHTNSFHITTFKEEPASSDPEPVAVAQRQVPMEQIMAAVADSGILRNPLGRSEEDSEDAGEERQSRDLIAATSLFAGIRNRLLSSNQGAETTAGANIRSNHINILETIIQGLVERVSEAEALKLDKPDPVSKAFLQNSLPIVCITSVEQREQSCTICCETFESFSVARRTPCNHTFHASCILPWLERKHSCPVCRANFPSLQEESEALKARYKERLPNSHSPTTPLPQAAANLDNVESDESSGDDDEEYLSMYS